MMWQFTQYKRNREKKLPHNIILGWERKVMRRGDTTSTARTGYAFCINDFSFSKHVFCFSNLLGITLKLKVLKTRRKKRGKELGKKIDYCLFSLCCTQNLASTSYIIYIYPSYKLSTPLHGGTFCMRFFKIQFSMFSTMWPPLETTFAFCTPY